MEKKKIVVIEEDGYVVYFIVNNDSIEYYVNGELITDCFPKSEGIIDLINEQLR